MVKIARAEKRVEYIQRLNDVRRRATLHDKLLSKALDTLSLNAADLGVGLLLLVAAQSMRQQGFSVGDLALFEAYLGWIASVISCLAVFSLAIAR